MQACVASTIKVSSTLLDVHQIGEREGFPRTPDAASIAMSWNHKLWN